MSHILKIGSLQARLGCKADRICAHRNDVLEIVDYKTNSSGKVPTLESLQREFHRLVSELRERQFAASFG